MNEEIHKIILKADDFFDDADARVFNDKIKACLDS